MQAIIIIVFLFCFIATRVVFLTFSYLHFLNSYATRVVWNGAHPSDSNVILLYVKYNTTAFADQSKFVSDLPQVLHEISDKHQMN